MKKEAKGFTLIELLLVIGIIATLAVVVFVALDPAKRFQDARNAKRISDVETILSAVKQYVNDSRGAFPPGLTQNNEQVLGTAGNGCSNGNGGCNAGPNECLDLSSDLARYLKTIPYDPSEGSSEVTMYSILRDGNDIVTVRACLAEGTEIEISN